MEDVVDKFLVRVHDDPESTAKSNKIKRLTEKMVGLLTKGKARHQIADAIKDINKKVLEIASRRARYTVDNIVANPAAVTQIDPRLGALYTEVAQLVGIAGKRDQELMKLLFDGDEETNKKLKIVSVVGFGGLGKTTLVKTVYDKMKGDFNFNAFVPVGRNSNAKKVLTDILLGLNIDGSQLTMLDERQLIDKLRKFLENKRYLVIIDDLWDEKLWRFINLAFSSGNNYGSRLITTTRILSVSKLCCSSTNDSIYQMEPLSDDDSKRLFYKRIFSHEGGCPHELEEASLQILKKCGGVPLAIITVASLLASDQQVKHVHEWCAVLQSIGRGLTDDQNVEEMLKILSFSYYDLPSHLKTCLLYIVMFPEDYKISKNQLIWMWIAESFVQCEKAEICLFEMGETYFNELVNRNMIMPLYDGQGTLVGCNVHDMVLDLLSSLSREVNFVTTLNGTSDSISSQSNIRRLSLQNARKEELETTSLESVRSVYLFESAIAIMPCLSSFDVLRVLELKGCDLRDRNHLNLRKLGRLVHLRYLGLARTRISELPEEVGKLQFLQVLDLSKNDDMKLPSTVIKLRRLTCLLIHPNHKRFPDGLGNLTSMEVLSKIKCDSLSTVKDLGRMGRLRELEIVFEPSLESMEAFVVSLEKLSKIQRLEIGCSSYGIGSIDVLGECWVPPRSLREFVTIGERAKFSKLPAWIRRNPSNLSQVSKLKILLEESRQEDLDILGRLPALCSLHLWSL
uniref:Uncharacterized protein n=2 Tax=Avena sativa TaxID=4498 RepID=A0ACD5WT00_AVESA